MTRYYFDIRDGTGFYPDEEGLEFSDQRAAEIEAVCALADLARGRPSLEDGSDAAIEVRTDEGPVFQAGFIFETNRTKR